MTTTLSAEKTALISAKILLKMADGMTIAEALDEVCGAGSYAALVSETYDRLRAKAAVAV